MIGIFPVWDIEQITLPSLSAAYGLSGTMLRDAVIKVNPARHPEALPDVPLVICHGLGDQEVPPAFHALALAQTHPLSLHLTRDGHSTQAFSLYDTPLIAGLLQSYVLKEG